jgi:hypothetical protein
MLPRLPQIPGLKALASQIAVTTAAMWHHTWHLPDFKSGYCFSFLVWVTGVPYIFWILTLFVIRDMACKCVLPFCWLLLLSGHCFLYVIFAAGLIWGFHTTRWPSVGELLHIGSGCSVHIPKNKGQIASPFFGLLLFPVHVIGNKLVTTTSSRFKQEGIKLYLLMVSGKVLG